MKTYYYYLRDPRDSSIRYIGQSKTQKKRFYSHIADARSQRDKNSRKSKWIRYLLANDMEPMLEVFDEHEGSAEQLHAYEWVLILNHLEEGHDLVNGNDGGAPYQLPDERVQRVYQYEKYTGEFVAEYRCAWDAAIATDIGDGNIGEVCRNEGVKSRSAGGYLWSYNYYEHYPMHIIPPIGNIFNRKRIAALNIYTDDIYWFDTAREAGKFLDIDYRLISACCNNRQKSSGDYYFCFADTL